MADPVYLYAYYAHTMRQVGTAVESACFSVSFLARSEAEATGSVMLIAKKRWPETDGWQQPTVGGGRVRDDHIRAVYACLPPEKPDAS